MKPLTKFIYFLCNNAARIALRIYFRKITVLGTKNVPPKGPVIVAVTHSNTLMDIAGAANNLPFRLKFLANYSLFKKPALAWLMRNAFFSIPIKRPKDVAPGEKVNNLATFKECTQLLASGGAIFMAPEGTSYVYRRLRPLKTGIARIALGVELYRRFKLHLKILPVGISYTTPEKQGGEMVVTFGKLIDVNSYKTAYFQDKRKCTQDLVEELEYAMLDTIVHTENEIEDYILKTAESLAQTDKISTLHHAHLAGRIPKQKVFLSKLRNTKNEFPQDYEDLYHASRQYQESLKSLAINDAQLLQTTKFSNLNLFAQSILYLLGIPLFIFGYLNNIIWLLPNFLIKKFKLYTSYHATIKTVGGLFLYPTWYIMLFTFYFIICENSWIALALSVLIIPLGFFALAYQAQIKKIFKIKRISQSPLLKESIAHREYLKRKLQDYL